MMARCPASTVFKTRYDELIFLTRQVPFEIICGSTDLLLSERSCNIKRIARAFFERFCAYRFDRCKAAKFYGKVVEIIVVGNRQLSKFL